MGNSSAAGKEMERKLDESWGYTNQLPKDIAQQVFDLCYASYAKGDKPSFTKVKELMDKLDK